MIRDAHELFAADGIETHVLGTGAIPGDFADALRECGYVVRHLPFRRSFGFFRQLYRWLAGQRFDVVHIHPEQAFVYYAFVCFLARVPRVVASIHNVYVYKKALRIRRRVHTWLTESCFGVERLAIGEAVFEHERMLYGARPAILHNWIDTNLFTPILAEEKKRRRAMLGLSDTDFVLIMVGACTDIKNHRRVFDMMAQLPSAYRHVKCLHLGTGECENAEKQQCRNSGLSDRVRFIGVSREVHWYMQVADLHVLPSLVEGVGNVFLEASACGLLSVVNDAPGLREVAQQGQVGLIADAGTDELARVIRAVADDPPAFAATAGRARELVLRRHRLETGVRRLITFYRQTNPTQSPAPQPVHA